MGPSALEIHMPKKGSSPLNVTPRAFKKDPATVGILDTAYKLQKAGSLQQAELLYQKVLAAEPGNPFAIYALGTIALNRGDAANAVMLLRQALTTGYAHETVYTHLGIALQSLGRLDEAMDVYQAGMKHDPKNPRYHSNAAVVLAQKGDHEAALLEAKVALKLNPKFAPASMNAGFVLQELNRLPEAVEMFNRTLRYDPGNAQVSEALKVIKQRMQTQPT